MAKRCFFSNKHINPSGSYFSARRKEAAHCGRFGALETNIQRWRAEGMVVFQPFLIYFARLVAIIGRSDSNTCTIYHFKQF